MDVAIVRSSSRRSPFVSRHLTAVGSCHEPKFLSSVYGFKPETGFDWSIALGLSDVVATKQAPLRYSGYHWCIVFSRTVFVINSILSSDKPICRRVR